MVRRKKKQTLTLLEIMIVIFLIGLIGSVIGYNMKGTLEEGKAFKSVTTKEKLYDILMLEVAKGHSVEDVIKHKVEFLDHSGLVKDARKLILDGWGKEFDVRSNANGTDIIIRSEAHDHYVARKKGKIGHIAKNEEAEQTADQEAQ